MQSSFENAHDQTSRQGSGLLYLNNIAVNVEDISGEGAKDLYYCVNSHPSGL